MNVSFHHESFTFIKVDCIKNVSDQYTCTFFFTKKLKEVRVVGATCAACAFKCLSDFKFQVRLFLCVCIVLCIVFYLFIFFFQKGECTELSKGHAE